MKKNKIIFLLPFLVLLFSSFSWGMTAGEIVDSLDGKYNSFKDLQMNFVQTVRSEVFTDDRKIRGKMYLENPDKFRVETSFEAVVSDGETLWVYSQQNKQVRKEKISRGDNVFRPTEYLYNFKDKYDSRLDKKEKVKNSLCYQLVLNAKSKDLFITKLILWVEENSFLVKKLEYQDTNDNWVSLVFDKIKMNSGLKKSTFHFKPPPGVEVVDLTK
jgi:outer membrane lipoprotein carrier protein